MMKCYTPYRHMGQIFQGLSKYLGGKCLQGCNWAMHDCHRHQLSHRKSQWLAGYHASTEAQVSVFPRDCTHWLAKVSTELLNLTLQANASVNLCYDGHCKEKTVIQLEYPLLPTCDRRKLQILFALDRKTYNNQRQYSTLKCLYMALI